MPVGQAIGFCGLPEARPPEFPDYPHIGPLWLREPRVACMVEKALQYGAMVRGFYSLYAWVIMPNHVHVVFEPRAAVPGIMNCGK